MAQEQNREFWRWDESNWKNPDVKWQDGQFVTVGIDVGSVSSQAVVMVDGVMYAYGNMRTGSDSPTSAEDALKFALDYTGAGDAEQADDMTVVVVRVPPRVLGPVDDADFRWVTDVGLTGPDKGAGGDYLFVPPGYKGTIPASGFNVSRPRTNRLLVFYRAFVERRPAR